MGTTARILTDPLTAAETVLRSEFSAQREGEAVRFHTSTLMPGGSTCSVVITLDEGGLLQVTDDWSARNAMGDLGVYKLRAADRRRASEAATKAGLVFVDDRFLLRQVTPEALASAVSHISDVSRSWAERVLDREFRSRRAEALEVVNAQLLSYFPSRNVARSRRIAGDSNTQHQFDFVVALADERIALFEVVSPSSGSIASAHLKFSDIRRRFQAWPCESILDRESGWTSENVALLSQVSNHVRAVNSDWSDIGRLAA